MAIETSELIDQIGLAFTLAQGQIEAAIRTSKNPAFKKAGKDSTYASLSDVQAALKEPLNKNGLFLIHPLVQASRENHTACQVYLGHGASGQFITSIFELAIDKQTPQGFGSAGTYTQRYALTSFFALEQEDDDGNKASGTKSVEAPTIKAPIDRPINSVERGKLNEIRIRLGKPPLTTDMKFSELRPAVEALTAEEKAKLVVKDTP